MSMQSAAFKMEDVGIEIFADELKPGTQLLQGQFTIESFLNAGGFGITYVARNSLNRRVVIKECFPGAFCRRTDGLVAAWSRRRQDEFRSLVTLFEQEAMNLSKLDHPNIVQVHQVFQDNETAYMAMDLIEGPDLLETVDGTAARLAPDQIVAVLGRVLDALGHVHGRGFLHRDISPDNILLDQATGQPVLIDFGAARKDETRKSRALSGLRVVKDGYSPQEFYITGSIQAPCSDLYALAATFSHLITGEAPKTSRERLSSIANRQGDPQAPLRGRVKDYPDAFLAAIDKAMSIFPRDRLQSVVEWLEMLGETALPDLEMPAMAAPPVAVAPQPTPTAVPLANPKRGTRREGLVQVAAVVLLLAGLSSIAGDIQDRLWATGSAFALTSETGATFVDPFTADVSLRMPFLPDPKVPGRIGALLPWSPDWMRPGQQIVEINGKPVQDGAQLQAMMYEGLDLTGQDNLKVIFGYQAVPGGQVIRRVETLPVVDSLTLEDGLAFESLHTPTGIRTVVSALPTTGEIDLEVGDVLLTYAPTGEIIGSASALAEILRREVKNDVATYGFALQRKGEYALGGFRLSSKG